jgi:hypothetical protein
MGMTLRKYNKGSGEDYGPKLTDVYTYLTGEIMPAEFTVSVMGWPIGWTALGPLATDRFQSWLKQFGNC